MGFERHFSTFRLTSVGRTSALALALMSVPLALAAPACGGSSEDSGGGAGTGGTPLGGAGGTGGTLASGGSGALGGGTGGSGAKDAATCPATLPPGWAPISLKPSNVQLGSCSPELLSEFVNKCSQYNSPPCPEFGATGDAAKEKCEACIWSKVTDSSWGPGVTVGTGAAMVNVAACLLMENGSAAQECASVLTDLNQCRLESCACNTDSYGNPYLTCINESDVAICKSYADKMSACASYANSECFGTDVPTALLFVANGFCGAGLAVADGGTDAGSDAAADAATDAATDAAGDAADDVTSD
jgi:hypothetical protein